MKKKVKVLCSLALLTAIALPTIVSATPTAKRTIGIDSFPGYIYQDCVTVGGISCYAWADSYADSRVTQVKAYAMGNGVASATDSGRYWAEATSYSGVGKARSEAVVNGLTATQHTRTLLEDYFWYGHYR